MSRLHQREIDIMTSTKTVVVIAETETTVVASEVVINSRNVHIMTTEVSTAEGKESMAMMILITLRKIAL